MNEFNNLKPTDILVWLSTVLAQQNIMIGKVLIELSKKNLEINEKNLEINTEIFGNNDITLNHLKNIEKYLLTLIEKMDKKNG